MSIECLLWSVDPATVERLIASPGRAGAALRLRAPHCDLHKAWHAIHYVLTGSADGGPEPHGYLLHGGVSLLGLDTGYDPPRLLRPEQVRAFNDVLQPINRLSMLRERFDHPAMVAAEVYCMNEGDADEDLEFTAEFFKLLRGFVKRTADAGHGTIIAFG
jgi:hypothetical protein